MVPLGWGLAQVERQMDALACFLRLEGGGALWGFLSSGIITLPNKENYPGY